MEGSEFRDGLEGVSFDEYLGGMSRNSDVMKSLGLMMAQNQHQQSQSEESFTVVDLSMRATSGKGNSKNGMRLADPKQMENKLKL